MTKQPWHQDGLYFECQRCGNCCSGYPGHVWVNDEEITSISRYLKIDETDFRKRYTLNIDGQGACLTERENNDCMFFNRSHGCVVYEHRPRQCQTWPFWKSNVATDQTWTNTIKICPGINLGRHYSIEEINSFIKDDGLR